MAVNTKQLEKKINKVYKTGNVKSAIELCQIGLQDDPTNADLHVRLGDLYLAWHLDIYNSCQYIDEAVTEYQRALETYIDSAEIYFKIGQAHYFKGDLDKAINYLDTAIAKNPKLGKAYYLLAETYTRKARFLEASMNAKKAIKVMPFANSCAHFLLSNIYNVSSARNFKNAFLSKFEFLLSLFTLPFDKIAIGNVCKTISYAKFLPVLIKGAWLSNSNKLNEALETYSLAVEKAPGFIPLYCLLGDIYRSLGQFDDAITEYKMAIWLDSLNIPAYRHLCMAYEEQGDYDSAVEIYEKLIQIMPNIYQESKQDLDAAISSYQSAYLQTPDDIDIYVNLGSAFYDKEDIANALQVYRNALDLDPENAKIHCNLGFLYWGKGDIDEALKEYELAIKFDPNYDIAYNNMGVIYLDDLGRVKQAADLFKKSVECNPNYALAHFNLARAISITGDKIEAAKLYQIAQDINKITNEIDPQDILDKINGLFE